MRWLALGLVACASAPAKPIAASPEQAAAAAPAADYPLRPTVRWLIAGPVIVSMPEGGEVTVPYHPGLTVREALRIGGAARAMKARGALTRFELDTTVDYTLPIGQILRYEAPDPELAPGDRLNVECLSEWGCR